MYCAVTIPAICMIMYRDSALPRFSLLAASFSQLSAVMYTPQKQNPISTRPSVQAQGSVTAAYRIRTAEIVDPRAANTRTCPTRWIIRGTWREANRNPRK